MNNNTSLESIKHTLQDSDWSVRNQAVKKLAQHQEETSLEIVLKIIKDQRPAIWWRSLLGDPYFQVGFIRRNAWRSVQAIGLYSEELLDCYKISLDDPYYEVRSVCLDTLWKHCNHNSNILDKDLKATLRHGLWMESNIDICLSLIPFTPLVIESEEIFILAARYLTMKHWRIRSAFIDILIDIAQEKPEYHNRIQNVLNSAHLMSEYFRPVFQLKLKQAELQEIINEAS